MYLVCLMGCGPSWPASRRLLEAREESTQVTGVSESERHSVLSSKISPATAGFGGGYMELRAVGNKSREMRTSQTCVEGFPLSDIGSERPYRSNVYTNRYGRDSCERVTYNACSSTTAVYIRGNRQTSAITVRLSADCSTLRVEQVEISPDTVPHSISEKPELSQGEAVKARRCISEPVLSRDDR